MISINDNKLVVWYIQIKRFPIEPNLSLDRNGKRRVMIVYDGRAAESYPFFYVLAFPVIAIVAVLSGAWTIRKEKQTRLEQEHSRVVAFLSSCIIGLLYMLAFPLIVIGALIKKLALGKMARQKVYSMNTSESVSERRGDVCKAPRRMA